MRRKSSAAMAVRMLSGRFSVFGRRLLIARATGRLYSTQNSESLSLLTDMCRTTHCYVRVCMYQVLGASHTHYSWCVVCI